MGTEGPFAYPFVLTEAQFEAVTLLLERIAAEIAVAGDKRCEALEEIHAALLGISERLGGPEDPPIGPTIQNIYLALMDLDDRAVDIDAAIREKGGAP